MHEEMHERRQSLLQCLIWVNSWWQQQLGISAPLQTAAGTFPFSWHKTKPFSRVMVHHPGQTNSSNYKKRDLDYACQLFRATTIQGFYRCRFLHKALQEQNWALNINPATQVSSTCPVACHVQWIIYSPSWQSHPASCLLKLNSVWV